MKTDSEEDGIASMFSEASNMVCWGDGEKVEKPYEFIFICQQEENQETGHKKSG